MEKVRGNEVADLFGVQGFDEVSPEAPPSYIEPSERIVSKETIPELGNKKEHRFGVWVSEETNKPFETLNNANKDMKEKTEARGKKSKGGKKPSIIAAPIAFTEEELRAYQYWCALSDAMCWLTKPPKDKESLQVVSDFMKIYAKIKAAMMAVEPGKKCVCIGKDPDGASDLLITNEWYTDAQGEADFVMSFFMGYIAYRTGYDIMKRMMDICEKTVMMLKEEKGRYKKDKHETKEQMEKLEMRVKGLTNACKKMERTQRLRVEDPLARSAGRLASKRPGRVKMTPIRMKGKKRSF